MTTAATIRYRNLYQETLEALHEAERIRDYWRGHAMTRERTVADLKRHLKDRDAHIRNLEAQLKPYLTRAEVDAEQESLL